MFEGDTKLPAKKRLKTIEANTQDDKQPEHKEGDKIPDMYQHIKEAKGETEQVLDTATDEQAEVQHKETLNVEETEGESSENLPPEETIEDVEMMESKSQKAEKLDAKDEKLDNAGNQHPEGMFVEVTKYIKACLNFQLKITGETLEEIETYTVEGDIVKTETVNRGTESFYHTNYSLEKTTPSTVTTDDIYKLRATVEEQLSKWHQVILSIHATFFLHSLFFQPPSEQEAEQAWQKISSLTASLAQDLSEQLRLVLEPTQATRLKGDFRTGRRINMRKVIPYIASQFRKDKIWLRRTKPSKRNYQIVLAIDDSSSMADNKSKELTFESVSLISKALTLLESGQLSVLSFGENVEIVHKLTEPFSERSGAMLMQKFKFSQGKTCITDVVNFATEMLNGTESTAQNAKLLLIISDGRLSTDSGSALERAIRRATLSNVFMVFVIVDDPNNVNSILDMRKVVFKDGKCIVESYMDQFPFPFYIVLKSIDSLPDVLSDALRQWFEIVTNTD